MSRIVLIFYKKPFKENGKVSDNITSDTRLKSPRIINKLQYSTYSTYSVLQQIKSAAAEREPPWEFTESSTTSSAENIFPPD